ncbi:MAG: amidase [Pseudomonadota bacterium]
MSPDEYRAHDAMGLTTLVKKGDVTPKELVEIAAKLITDERLNAFIALDLEGARVAAAKGPSGPFAGVPFAIKDLNTTMAGLPATKASALLANAVAAEDSEIVRRIRAAGLIPMGLTNTPEFGLNVSTEPLVYGATRHPRDPTGGLSPGGSSGGSAAAVAGGLVPAAHATDSSGSIRIPAALCGLIGLKPSRGRTPLLPDIARDRHTITSAHALTRTVRDCAALLDAVSAPFAATAAPPDVATVPYAQSLDLPLGVLRCVLIESQSAGIPVAPGCIATAQETAARLSDFGLSVRVAPSPVQLPDLWGPMRDTLASRMAKAVEGARTITGSKASAEPLVEELAHQGQAMTEADHRDAAEDTRRITAPFAALFEDADLVITPTIAVDCLQLGTLDTQKDAATFFPAMMGVAAYAPLYNITGLPAISLPMGVTDRGDPLGIMIGARFGREDVLLRLAAHLEADGAFRADAHTALGGSRHDG